MSAAVTPNAPLPRAHAGAITAGWALLVLVAWTLWRPVLLPGPVSVVTSWPALWSQGGLGQALATSFATNLEAVGISALIALPIAYASRVPIVRPVALALAKLRFLSPAVFFMVLLFALRDAHTLKLGMLVLGISSYLLTSMVTVVQGLPDTSFDEARLLRMDEWKATWYVVVRGTLPQAIDALRDNAAMGWSMLMMVEGLVRGEGGVGVLLLEQEKYFNLAAVYAIALAILAGGLLQDTAWRALRAWLCPYQERA